MEYWASDYCRGVLELADRVRDVIGPERVVLVETPSGPMSGHCHGGLSADFGFNKTAAGLKNYGRITASPVRYGMPEIRYFSNGLNLNELHQIYAAGHRLALCNQHRTEGNASYIKKLVCLRKAYKDALIEGRQTYQPATASDEVAAYHYTGHENEIITVVNTSEILAYIDLLRLRPLHADSLWTDLLTKRTFAAVGTNLGVVVPPTGLLVLLRQRG
jgi:hypothetical protein